MTNELKSCKRCMENGVVVLGVKSGGYRVWCTRCKTITLPFKNEADAVIAWTKMNENYEDNMADELKPCKICKSKNVAMIGDEGIFRVHCFVCGFKTLPFKMREDAVNSWNDQMDVGDTSGTNTWCNPENITQDSLKNVRDFVYIWNKGSTQSPDRWADVSVNTGDCARKAARPRNNVDTWAEDIACIAGSDNVRGIRTYLVGLFADRG